MGCNPSDNVTVVNSLQENAPKKLIIKKTILQKYKQIEEYESINLKEMELGFFYCEKYFTELNSNHNCLFDEKQIEKWLQMIEFYHHTQESARMRYINSRASIRNIYVDTNILEAEAELGLANYLILNPEKFVKRMKKGPPCQYRWLAWKACTKFNTIFVKGRYDEIKSQSCEDEFESTIKKDINRTFPHHQAFANNNQRLQNILFNILRAYSIYNNNVGYCQGMNFLVGFLLIISGFREEEVFWVFVAIMENQNKWDKFKIEGLKGVYSNYFPLLQQMNELFRVMLINKLPNLRNHLDHQSISELMYFSKWVLSVFLYNFNLIYCVRIWDHFLISGYSFFLTFSISLFEEREKDLINLNFEEINNLLSEIGQCLGINSLEKILKRSSKYKIEWETLEKERVLIELRINREIEDLKRVQIKNTDQANINEQFQQGEKNKSQDPIDESLNMTDALIRNSKLLDCHKPSNNRSISQLSKRANETGLPPINGDKATFLITKDILNENLSLADYESISSSFSMLSDKNHLNDRNRLKFTSSRTILGKPQKLSRNQILKNITEDIKEISEEIPEENEIEDDKNGDNLKITLNDISLSRDRREFKNMFEMLESSLFLNKELHSLKESKKDESFNLISTKSIQIGKNDYQI